MTWRAIYLVLACLAFEVQDPAEFKMPIDYLEDQGGFENPVSESEVTGWSVELRWYIAGDIVPPIEGADAAIKLIRTSFPSEDAHLTSDQIAVPVGVQMAVRYYAVSNTFGQAGDTPMRLEWTEDGTWHQIDSFLEAGDSAESEWERRTGLFTSTTGSVRIRFVQDNYSPTIVFGAFAIDGVTVETAVVAYTQTLKDAIVADLEDIDGTGIFTSAVAEVGREPKRFDEAKKPGIFIMSAEFDDNPETLNTKTGETLQVFNLQAIIHSTTPNQDADDLTDDIRNALQRGTSNVLGVTGVNDVIVSGSGAYTSPGIHENHYMIDLAVTVQYFYTRGSL